MKIILVSKCCLIISLLLLVFSLGLIWQVNAQSEGLILKWEQHWDTYGSGGTCVPGGNNLAVKDVNGDGVKEIVTGGFAYTHMPNGSRMPSTAPLKIWRWDGQNLTLAKSGRWPGSISCVYVADVDGDVMNEIITAGAFRNETGIYSSLRVWSWDNDELSLRVHYEGVSVSSIFVSDLDNDGKPEILTVGSLVSDSVSTAQMCLWRLEKNGLILKGQAKLDVANVRRANSVYAFDLNNDGEIEIIVAGYSNDLNNSRGHLSVWRWNDQAFSLLDLKEWREVEGYGLNSAGGIQGNTIVSNMKVADVDGDGVPEIITVGFTYDGAQILGQLRIWNWSRANLNLEKSHEWENLAITQAESISVNDVDGDGKNEIVTSGYTAGYGSFAAGAENKTRAELKVWSWDGTTLILEHSKDWLVEEAASARNVDTGDLDNDGTVEIVTVGCIQLIDSRDCDPNLRIWAVASEASTFPRNLIPLIAALAVVAISVTVTAFILSKRKERKA